MPAGAVVQNAPAPVPLATNASRVETHENGLVWSCSESARTPLFWCESKVQSVVVSASPPTLRIPIRFALNTLLATFVMVS